jgi:hypothetical protein
MESKIVIVWVIAQCNMVRGTILHDVITQKTRTLILNPTKTPYLRYMNIFRSQEHEIFQPLVSRII